MRSHKKESDGTRKRQSIEDPQVTDLTTSRRADKKEQSGGNRGEGKPRMRNCNRKRNRCSIKMRILGEIWRRREQQAVPSEQRP